MTISLSVSRAAGQEPISVAMIKEAFVSRIGQLLTAFAGPGGAVGIERSGTKYYLLAPIQSGQYNTTRLETYSFGGTTEYIISQIESRVALLSLEDDDPAAVTAGTWVALTDSRAYGGDYRYSKTANDTLTFTTPANTNIVGARHCSLTNGGVAKVAIDGDLTRATLLPTAQDLVTAGTLASTVLIANGGTLAPTDRILNNYGANNWDNKVIYCNDLAAGVHTVVITICNYKQAASTDTRVYFGGLMYGATWAPSAPRPRPANARIPRRGAWFGICITASLGQCTARRAHLIPTIRQHTGSGMRTRALSSSL